jgi:hypothetical protein
VGGLSEEGLLSGRRGLGAGGHHQVIRETPAQPRHRLAPLEALDHQIARALLDLHQITRGLAPLEEEEAALGHLEEVEHHLAHQVRHGAVEVGLGQEALAGEERADAQGGRHLAERDMELFGRDEPQLHHHGAQPLVVHTGDGEGGLAVAEDDGALHRTVLEDELTAADAGDDMAEHFLHGQGAEAAGEETTQGRGLAQQHHPLGRVEMRHEGLA